MKSRLLSLLLCPMALGAQEAPPITIPEPVAIIPSSVNQWSQGFVSMSTHGTPRLLDVIGSMKEQLGELNWIMQGDVGDIELPAFSVKDVSPESLLTLLGTAAGFEVQSAPPQAPGQQQIVMIRRSTNPPAAPQASTAKDLRTVPMSANDPEPKKSKGTSASAAPESVPLPSKQSAKIMKVMSLGAFSDEASWARNVRGLSSLLHKTLTQGGKLPDDALTFDDESRLLIIRMEPERAGEAVQLVEGFVASLKERQAAVDEQIKDLLKKKVATQMELKSATSLGKGENHPQIQQLELELDSLAKAIAEIEESHGLR
ncbi:hypothetical protein [Luteolibacter soli]|uniref:Secretin/TonB short N-terminal domain-containing protein n=1 Tax=Luteolibacter soli TaxID=3135280 RepID=A0ABU9ARZ1_9BACT